MARVLIKDGTHGQVTGRYVMEIMGIKKRRHHWCFEWEYVMYYVIGMYVVGIQKNQRETLWLFQYPQSQSRFKPLTNCLLVRTIRLLHCFRFIQQKQAQ